MLKVGGDFAENVLGVYVEAKMSRSASLPGALVRLAHANPGPIRDALVPLLKQAGMPPKAILNKAVKEMQLYLGSIDYAHVKDQEKLHRKVMRSVNALVEHTGMGSEEVWRQLDAEARRRGILRPRPGQHI